MPVPMVRCNAMAWTDETDGRLKVLVTRSDPVVGTVAMMEERAVPRARFTASTPASPGKTTRHTFSMMSFLKI
jgi:hypothetical protein